MLPDYLPTGLYACSTSTPQFTPPFLPHARLYRKGVVCSLEEVLYTKSGKQDQYSRARPSFTPPSCLMRGFIVKGYVVSKEYCVCVLSSHLFWTSGLWAYQPGSHHNRNPFKCHEEVLYLLLLFSSHTFWTSSSLDVPAGVTQEEGHTGFLIHLLSAVRALIFLARRIQPFFSLVDR